MNAPIATTFVLQPNTVMQVPIGALCRDPGNREISTESIKAMAEDIGVRGIELPIVVRSDFVIKDGERRWRAAKLAGLETVPCILAGPAAEQNGAVEWRLDQVADNHHREPLNALDWARVLRELVDVHQMAVKDIPTLLKARGIDMSRPYISNLIRLNDLPDWAKAMIASGVLPPGAGKYVLMCAAHPPAMEKLRAQLEGEAKRLEPGHGLRADLGWQVRNAFTHTATELSTNYSSDKPRFAWKESCKDCTTRGQVNSDHFCFNRPCFDKKQAAADATAKTKPGTAGQTTTKRKADPKEAMREAARKRQQLARSRARETAITQVLAAAGKKDIGVHDRRLIAAAMLREMQHESLKKVFTHRGWEPKKEQYGRNYYAIGDREIAKLNETGLDGLLLECALRGALNIGYFSAGVDYLAITAKRYRIDLKALEKAASAELKPKPAAAKRYRKLKPKPTAKPTRGKS